MEIAGHDAELPEIRQRARYFAGLVGVMFLALCVRLFYLQVVEGDTYYKVTADSIVRTAELPAMRGEIKDCKGRVLATTRPSYDVYVSPDQITAEAYARLRVALGPEADALPTLESLQRQGRKAPDKSLLVAEDIARDAMASLETELDNPGLKIVAAPRRHYPLGTVAAHALGYMNEVSADEVRGRKDEGYRSGDLIGRTGLERQWEPYLRGSKGFEKVVVDRRGLRRSDLRVQDLVEGPTRQDPVPGSNVVLTLDADLQRITERAMRNTRASAVVVLEVETGRILAMASRPTFDPNVMSGKLSDDAEARILSDRLHPFRDKALSEVYNPGSTFKVISALAGLEERLITADDKVRCGGFIELGRRRFRCTHTHGVVTLRSAIVQSCNVYFYELGARPGMLNRLARFATEFGLGAPAGLGLNGEQPGFVPTEEWHRAQTAKDPTQGNVIGHALNTAIGEGATRVTVLQMALLYAAVANGGKLWLPQIVERIESPAGQVMESFPPRARRDVSVSAESLTFVRRALVGVVNESNGTAYRARSSKVEMAGKTGTSQVQRAGRKRGEDPPLPYELVDHAWFAGFAPVANPRIAFAVMVEHGGFGGEAAAPIASEIVDGYFDQNGAVAGPSPRPRPGGPGRGRGRVQPSRVPGENGTTAPLRQHSYRAARPD
jgi:penicillin-binding protein 2